MPLPDFNSQGDLPVGVHRATFDEVLTRFGGGTRQREAVTNRLRRIHQLAVATGKLTRLVIFGSYITSKPAPNDVDIVLIMSDGFSLDDCDQETSKIFDHQQAQQQLGASIFWTCPAAILLEGVDPFIAHWQIKRDQQRRGIVEVRI